MIINSSSNILQLSDKITITTLNNYFVPKSLKVTSNGWIITCGNESVDNRPIIAYSSDGDIWKESKCTVSSTYTINGVDYTDNNYLIFSTEVANNPLRYYSNINLSTLSGDIGTSYNSYSITYTPSNILLECLGNQVCIVANSTLTEGEDKEQHAWSTFPSSPTNRHISSLYQKTIKYSCVDSTNNRLYGVCEDGYIFYKNSIGEDNTFSGSNALVGNNNNLYKIYYNEDVGLLLAGRQSSQLLLYGSNKNLATPLSQTIADTSTQITNADVVVGIGAINKLIFVAWTSHGRLKISLFKPNASGVRPGSVYNGMLFSIIDNFYGDTETFIDMKSKDNYLILLSHNGSEVHLTKIKVGR